MGTVRFSVGRHTTAEDIDQAAEIVIKALKPLLPESAPEAISAAPDHSDIKLTHFTAGLGCACKLRPQALEKVLANLPPSFDPNAIVDAATNDPMPLAPSPRPIPSRISTLWGPSRSSA
jgi:hypothetical protein